MFPPGFSRFGRLGPPGGAAAFGAGLRPQTGRGAASSRPAAGCAPRTRRPPRRAQPPFSCKNNLKKRPKAAFSKGPTGSGLFCLAQEYQPLPLLQFFLGVPQGRSQGAAGDGEAFCHIV